MNIVPHHHSVLPSVLSGVCKLQKKFEKDDRREAVGFSVARQLENFDLWSHILSCMLDVMETSDKATKWVRGRGYRDGRLCQPESWPVFEISFSSFQAAVFFILSGPPYSFLIFQMYPYNGQAAWSKKNQHVLQPRLCKVQVLTT